MCFNSNELPTVTNEDGAEMTPIAGPVLDYQSVMVDDGTGSSVTALFKLGVQLAEMPAEDARAFVAGLPTEAFDKIGALLEFSLNSQIGRLSVVMSGTCPTKLYKAYDYFVERANADGYEAVYADLDEEINGLLG